MTVMHSLFDATSEALERVAGRWDGPLGVYPNIGQYKAPGGWDVSNVPSPQEFGDMCEKWAAMGARIIGGCCGVGPS